MRNIRTRSYGISLIDVHYYQIGRDRDNNKYVAKLGNNKKVLEYDNYNNINFHSYNHHSHHNHQQ